MRLFSETKLVTLWTLVLILCSNVFAGLQDSLSGGGLTKPTPAPLPPPIIIPGGEDPDFRQPIKNVTVPVGREAILACSVTELGHYKVGWMRAEDQTILTLHTKVVTHNSRISVTHDNHRTWNLHIRQVKEADRGCYMCQINTNIMKKQIGCVDVHVPPDISDEETSSDITVQEGENATLVCRATGHPAPRILWRREDGESLVIRKGPRDVAKVDTYSGDTLQLVKLEKKQMGAYLCIASNDVPPAVSKRITLNVNFAPIIKVPNQLLGTPLGTDVHLECYVEAFPNTINYWMKNMVEMLLDSRKHVVEEDKNSYRVHLKLTIRNFAPKDIGTYTCVSTNSLGRADGTVRLYEIKVPTKPPPPTTEKPIITTTVTPSYEAPTTKASKLRQVIATTFAAPLELDSSLDENESRDDEPPREATANASRAGGERATSAAAGGLLAPLLALLVAALSSR